MSSSAIPFDDIRNLLRELPSGSRDHTDAVRRRNGDLVKLPGSLGRLEEIAQWLAAWQRRDRPAVDRTFTVIFAASHGVSAHGLSKWSDTATRHMMETYAAGGGASNQIAASFGAGLKVFELALDHPTGDFTCEAALDERAAAATFAFGMEAIAGGPDLLCLGELGADNGVSAAAVYCALYGGEPREWAAEAGLDASTLARRCDAIEKALALHRSHCIDPLEIMRRLGGRETCAIAGAIVAARLQNVPVVLDGYNVCAAAALLHAMEETALDHCIAGHVSAQPRHRDVLARFGKQPLLDLGISLGEGAGATLAAGIIKAAVACHNDMATFEQAKVARPAGQG